MNENETKPLDETSEEKAEAKEESVSIFLAFLLLLVCMGPAILIAIIQRAR